MRISDWSSDVCSSDLCRQSPAAKSVSWIGLLNGGRLGPGVRIDRRSERQVGGPLARFMLWRSRGWCGFEFAAPVDRTDVDAEGVFAEHIGRRDRKSTRLNSSH